jgi:predicted TPR repeat methyltransferase
VIVARAYLRVRKGTPAVEFAQAAVGLRPGHAYCWYVLGQSQETVGWLDRAAVSYTRALDLSPGMPQAKAAFKNLQQGSFAGKLARRIGGLFSR